MVREGATVLGNNATTGNQRLAPQPALPYKRSLNFVTGQKQSASGSAGVTPTTTSRRSETAPSSRTVTAPPPTVQSRPPTVSSRPAPAINISRRVGGDQNPASLTADRNRERPRDREVATEREREREWDREREPERERERPVERDLGHRDADGTMLSSRSAMFGNLSTIGGPSENVVRASFEYRWNFG